MTNQGIKHHRPTLAKIHLVALQCRLLCRRVRVLIKKSGWQRAMTGRSE